MKKTLTKISILVLIIIGTLTLTACGKKDEKKDAKEDVHPIVGTWAYENRENYVYYFNKDGTGKYDAYGNIMEFTYEIDGDNISILYKGNTDPFETKYTINGNKLNIIDSFGNDTIYIKK